MKQIDADPISAIYDGRMVGILNREWRVRWIKAHPFAAFLICQSLIAPLLFFGALWVGPPAHRADAGAIDWAWPWTLRMLVSTGCGNLGSLWALAGRRLQSGLLIAFGLAVTASLVTGQGEHPGQVLERLLINTVVAGPGFLMMYAIVRRQQRKLSSGNIRAAHE